MKNNKFSTNKEKEIQDLIEKVGELLKEDDQGFIFSTFSTDNKADKTIMNCINTKDPEMFWLGMVPLVLNMNKICPEDERDKFRENFMAFTALVTDECFPSLQLKEE